MPLVKNEGTNWDIPIEEFNWRIATAKKDLTAARYVPYPDARTVAKHLDRIFGWENWADQYELVTHPNAQKPGILCTLTITIPPETYITKQGVGHLTDIEPWKGGESDAFKRAAAKLGVGRNAYDVPEVWGPVKEFNGKAYAPKGVEKELVAKAKKLLAEGEKPERDADTETPPLAPEADPQYAVSQEDWDALMSHMKAMDKNSKGVIIEWWGEHGDGKAKPKRDIAQDVYDKLMERVIIEALEGNAVEDEAPF